MSACWNVWPPRAVGREMDKLLEENKRLIELLHAAQAELIDAYNLKGAASGPQKGKTDNEDVTSVSVKIC